MIGYDILICELYISFLINTLCFTADSSCCRTPSAFVAVVLNFTFGENSGDSVRFTVVLPARYIE